jgi:hypothetical protein
LDSELKIHIDKLATHNPARQYREISTTPRDIARSVSADPESNTIEEELLNVKRRDQNPGNNLETYGSSRTRGLSKKQLRKQANANRVQKLSRSQRKKQAKAT